MFSVPVHSIREGRQRNVWRWEEVCLNATDYLPPQPTYLHVVDRFKLPNCAHVLDNVIRSSTASTKLGYTHTMTVLDDLCGANSRMGDGRRGKCT